MNKYQLAKIKKIFYRYAKLKLVYFFGSRAAKRGGPLSDYDFAFYFAEKDKRKLMNYKLTLIDQISRALKTDNVDIVILNLTESPELKYNIIYSGRLIYEKEPYRVMVEPRIWQEYFDFNFMLKRYHLTKA